MKKQNRLLLLALPLAALAGCATISSPRQIRREMIHVESLPSGGVIELDCGTASGVAPGTTPADVEIPRRQDPCRLTVSKAGFRTFAVELTRRVRKGFYGNIASPFGGLLIGAAAEPRCQGECWFGGYSTAIGTATGMIIGGIGMGVDAATGAMWEHEPKQVEAVLVRVEAPAGERAPSLDNGK